MKKKILVSSILTIALCLSLIAGSTFALFTSTSEQTIVVTSGKVEMTADIEGLTLYSVEGKDGGAIVDENGYTYEYKTLTGDTFTNGGTAIFDEATATLTMDKVTPGDKVSFTLTGANTSNVAIQYRYKIECLSGHALMHGFNTYISEDAATLATSKYAALNSYVTEWRALAANTAMADVLFEIELPVTAGNEYQDIKEAEIKITVEAVQGNAVTENDNVLVTYIEKAATAADVETLLADADTDYITLSEDIVDVNDKIDLSGTVANKTIDANGYNAFINVADNTVLDNVVITNLVDDDVDGQSAIYVTSTTSGDLTVTNSYFNDPSSGWGNIQMRGNQVALTVTDCVFEGGKYAVYSAGGAGNVEIYNCQISNSTSWALQFNGAVPGNVVVDGCTFTNCKGILKAAVSGGIAGNLDFTNNAMVNCVLKDGKFAETNTAGTITFDNNTLNGNLAALGDMVSMN